MNTSATSRRDEFWAGVRAELKKKINLATGSDLVEEKSYEHYTGKG